MIAKLRQNGQLVVLRGRQLAAIRGRKTILRRCTSRYKGVYWDREKERWRAAVECRGRRYRLGRYRSEEDAAIAYDRKAVALWGRHAKTNLL